LSVAEPVLMDDDKPSKINFLYTCKFCEENKILDNEGKAIKIKAEIKVSPNLIKLLQREGHEIPFNDYKMCLMVLQLPHQVYSH